MDAQYPGSYPPQRLMEFNADDLDVSPQVEFEEPVTEVHRHPDAAIPATPPRPRGYSDIRIDAASSTFRHPPLVPRLFHSGGTCQTITNLGSPSQRVLDGHHSQGSAEE